MRQTTPERTLLISWGARALYLGPGLQLPAHRNAVAVLALALQAPMRVALDPRDLEKGFVVCRSVLIEPNQLHLIEMTTQTHAFIYLDALSRDLVTLRAHCSQRGDACSFHLKNEAEVVELLARLPCTAENIQRGKSQPGYKPWIPSEAMRPPYRESHPSFAAASRG